MADVRMAFNRSAFSELMNGRACQAVIERKAAAVQAAADGQGSATYAHNTQPGKKRCHGIVFTPSEHAIRSNAKHNSLLKALYGGGA